MRAELPFFLLSCLLLAHTADAGTTTNSMRVMPRGKPDTVARFAKSLYSEMEGSMGNVTYTVDKLRDRFDALNKTTHGMLETALDTFAEIRMLELQASVRQAKKMQAVLDALEWLPTDVKMPEMR